MGIIMTTKELRPRQPRDFYPTPELLVNAALNCIEFQRTRLELPAPKILDPGCGEGVWGRVARRLWPDAKITGVDIEPGICEAYDNVIRMPFPMGVNGKFDFVIGNPPYSHAEEFIRASLAHLHPQHGVMMFLLRLPFLASQSRGRGLFKEFQPKEVYVLCQRPSFTGDDKTDATDYCLVVWLNKFYHIGTAMKWLDWKVQS